MPQDLDKIRQIKQAAEVDLLKRPGVTGVDVGYKYIGGKRTDEIVIRVHVYEKKDVPPDEKVPDTIDGVKTDVLQTRIVPAVDSGMYTPILGGIEISSSRIVVGGVGTLGAIVVDNTSKDALMLSNYHVLCGNDLNWHEGDLIAQPQLLVGGKGVGALVNGILDEGKSPDPGPPGVDAAVARFGRGPLLGDRGHINRIVEIGPVTGPVTGTATAVMGEAVRKRGRTTGLTYGTVDGIEGSNTVDYGGKIGKKTFYHQITVKADETRNQRFFDHGDSGSVLVNSDGAVTGLLFAFDEGTGATASANPIKAVLSELNVSMAVCLPPPISPATRLTSCVVSGNMPRLYYLDPHDHVMELGWFTGKLEPGFGVYVDHWYGVDVTANANYHTGQDAPTPNPTTSLTSCVLSGDRLRVYYLAENYHVIGLDLNGQWGWTDVTDSAKFHQRAGDPPAPLSSSPLTSCVSGDRPRVYYLAENYHVIELGWSGQWGWTDVTDSAKNNDKPDQDAPAALSSSPLTSCAVSVHRDWTRVYYLAENRHVIELGWSGAPHWGWTDVTDSAKIHQRAGDPPNPLSSSPLTSCALTHDDWTRVYYVAENRHVIELGWSGQWGWTDVTDSAKNNDKPDQDPPAPLSSSPLSTCALSHNDWMRVYYVAENPHHVIELGWSGAPHWGWADATKSAKNNDKPGEDAPAPLFNSPLTSCALNHDQTRVYWFDPCYHVIELGWSSPWGWGWMEIFVDQ